jgi:uncharacterized protein YkwD
MSKNSLPRFVTGLFLFLLFATIQLTKTYALEAQPAQEAVTMDEQESEEPTPNPTINPTASPTPKPTVTPSSTPKPTSTPTLRPIQTATPLPLIVSTPRPIATATPRPTTSPTPSSTLLTYQQKQDYIMNAINAYRASQGLYAVKKDTYTCNFAKVRAKEISTNFSHDGFRSRINNHTLPYPSFRLITENIAMTSNYKNVVSMWINSSGHALNMRRDTPYVCVEFYGNYFAYEGWKP